MTGSNSTNPPVRPGLFRRVRLSGWSAIVSLLLLGSTPAFADAGVRLGDELRGRLASLPPVTGDPIEAGALDGKVVVVSFFASWCPPCRAEFEHLNEMFGEFASDPVVIAAVNVFEEWPGTDNEDRMARFLAEFSPRFAVLTGNAQLRQSFGNVERIPTVFVFDREGQPTLHFIHARGAKKMNVEIHELRKAIRLALDR